jgi:hypothetical protein
LLIAPSFVSKARRLAGFFLDSDHGKFRKAFCDQRTNLLIDAGFF